MADLIQPISLPRNRKLFQDIRRNFVPQRTATKLININNKRRINARPYNKDLSFLYEYE